MAAHRRRNKVVLWEWAPDGGQRKQRRDRPRRRSIARDTLAAVVLLGVIALVLSTIPPSGDGRYRRDYVARYACEVVGTNPDTPQCTAVAIGGWWLIVIAIGLVLKFGARLLASVGIGRGQS